MHNVSLHIHHTPDNLEDRSRLRQIEAAGAGTASPCEIIRKICFFVQQAIRKQQNQQTQVRQTAWTSLSVYLAALALGALLCSGCATAAGPSVGQSPLHSQAGVLTYVAIGASDTFGVGADDPYTENWPDQLAFLLKRPVHLLNLGVPGMTVHAALRAELPVALDAHPGLVTVWLAVNDLASGVTLPDYSHDLDSLLGRLQAMAPHAQVAVGNVPDLTSVPFFSGENPLNLRQRVTAYNGVISNIVGRHHALLVDLSGQGYNLQAFPQYISHDGLHPSSIGYLQLAELFYEALQKKDFPGRAA
jgi:lysophospholipase L1-like esterase